MHTVKGSPTSPKISRYTRATVFSSSCLSGRSSGSRAAEWSVCRGCKSFRPDSRSRAVWEARRVHTPKAAGSNPVSAIRLVSGSPPRHSRYVGHPWKRVPFCWTFQKEWDMIKYIQYLLFEALLFLYKWVSINYERQISGNIKLKVNILGGVIMLMHEVIVNQWCVNGICCDRL